MKTMKTLYWLSVVGAGIYFFGSLSHVNGIVNAHIMDCRNGVEGTHNCWLHK